MLQLHDGLFDGVFVEESPYVAVVAPQANVVADHVGGGVALQLSGDDAG